MATVVGAKCITTPTTTGRTARLDLALPSQRAHLRVLPPRVGRAADDHVLGRRAAPGRHHPGHRPTVRSSRLSRPLRSSVTSRRATSPLPPLAIRVCPSTSTARRPPRTSPTSRRFAKPRFAQRDSLCPCPGFPGRGFFSGDCRCDMRFVSFSAVYVSLCFVHILLFCCEFPLFGCSLINLGHYVRMKKFLCDRRLRDSAHPPGLFPRSYEDLLFAPRTSWTLPAGIKDIKPLAAESDAIQRLSTPLYRSCPWTQQQASLAVAAVPHAARCAAQPLSCQHRRALPVRIAGAALYLVLSGATICCRASSLAWSYAARTRRLPTTHASLSARYEPAQAHQRAVARDVFAR